MQRHILQSLSQWKRKPNRKPLIIQGARQVGKTWVMKAFGAAEFEQVAYINFDNNPQMQALFGGDFDINRLLLGLSIEAGVSINAYNTLLIFDEIQAVPQALTALKYFYEKAPHLPIIAAGSLLGVALHCIRACRSLWAKWNFWRCIRWISANFCWRWTRSRCTTCCARKIGH